MKQYFYGRQMIGDEEIEAVSDTLRSDWLTQGPKVEEFERAICVYTGAKYCVAVANGTAALHLAVLALDLTPGFEGITSPMTFTASANSILYARGKVRFADINIDTGLIGIEELEKQVSRKTKVLIPVHYAGQSCDMERIKAIARENKLFVIEDAAHAIGSKYNGEKVGNCKYSDMCVFSFHPVKTLTTGEGGAITTNNREFYERLLLLRTHGITKDPKKMGKKNPEPWWYEMRELGFNYRLSDIQATLGIVQMKRLDQFIKRRREIVQLYNRAFAEVVGLKLLKELDYSDAAWHLCPLLIDFEKLEIDKVEFFHKMASLGMNLQVHYIPVPLQPYYQSLGFDGDDFPQALRFYEQVISLPCYPGLSNKDIGIIVNKILTNLV